MFNPSVLPISNLALTLVWQSQTAINDLLRKDKNGFMGILGIARVMISLEKAIVRSERSVSGSVD
jgi:hypothetical protein